MRRWLWLAAILLVVALALLAVRRSNSSRDPSGARAESGGQPVSVGVDDLMRNADRYRSGPVRVEGVVSRASSSSERTMTLIDIQEFKQCGLGCAELMLPVRWSGSMPAVKESVRVEGEIQEDSGKLIFVARSVESLGKGD